MQFPIDLLIPGVVIVKDITCETKKDFLIPAGTTLTKEHINRCMMRNIQYAYIKINDKNTSFNDVFTLIVAKTIKDGKVDKLKKLSLVYKSYIEAINDIKFDFTKYTLDRSQSLNPYRHIANVTNMVLVLGKYYNKKVPKKEQIPLDKLALASLMQDTGRVAYNPKVLSTLKIDHMTTVNNLRRDYPGIPGNVLYRYLQDFHGLYGYLLTLNQDIDETVRKTILFHQERYNNRDVGLGISLKLYRYLQDFHGLYGYLLTLNQDIDETVRKTILFHQERYNNRDVGLGISLKLYRKDKLASLMAMFIRVCDIYDELLYEGPKKNKQMPFNNIPKLLSVLISKDYIYGDAVKLMFEYIPLFRIGSIVRLSDNRLAIVSRIEPDNQFCPTCVDFDYRYIDMKKERLKVVNLVSEEELRK